MVVIVAPVEETGLPPDRSVVCPYIVGPTSIVAEYVSFVESYDSTKPGSGDFVGPVTTLNPL
jgi:hypothetical protein